MRTLTPEEKTFFADEGYLMIPDVFEPADIEPLRRELTDVIHRGAQQLLAEGKISQLYEEDSFERRLTRIYAECEEIVGAITGGGGGGHSGGALFEFITHPKLLSVVESFVGPEIVGSSVYRIRPKIPGMAKGIVPWHQDSGYFSPHCDEDLILTCWMPLVDATVENGCLQVLPRTHRQGVIRHYTNGPNGYLAIGDEDLPPIKPIAVPVPLGGALFMTNRTPHCSTPNTTDVVRWSLDLRYQDAKVPNNVGELPQEYDPDRPTPEIACYPPEADFIIQSPSAPEAVCRTAAEFDQIRQRYQTLRPPGPDRGWAHYDERPV